MPGIKGIPFVVALKPIMHFWDDDGRGKRELRASNCGDPFADADLRVNGLSGNHNIVFA